MQEHRLRLLEMRKDVSALEAVIEELERRRAGHEDRVESLRQERQSVEDSLAGIRERMDAA